LRRQNELAAQGGGTAESIRTGLLALQWRGANIFDGILVDENASAYPDALGRPPHSIEVVIQPASWLEGLPEAELVPLVALFENTLWRLKPAGIDMFGRETSSRLDSMGIARTLHYSVANLVQVFVSVQVAIDPAAYAGDEALKQAMIDWGSTLKLGEDVTRVKLLCAVADLCGVTDIPSLLIGFGPAVLREQNLTIQPRDLARLDSSHITVTHP
jgi:hypothetical protein